jgi:hypothetical protein
MKKYIFLLLSIGLIFSFCKKKKEDPVPPDNAKYFFQATIDGQEIVFNDGVNGFGCGAGSSGSSMPSGYCEEPMKDLLLVFFMITFF